MFTEEVTAETPIVQMTAGQLADYLNKNKPDTSTQEAVAAQGRRFVYGIKGIMELFKVSNVTAQRYKRGIIKDAVSQRGRIIVVDAEKALQLFNERRGQ
jgi:hypothetical protein